VTISEIEPMDIDNNAIQKSSLEIGVRSSRNIDAKKQCAAKLINNVSSLELLWSRVQAQK